MDDADYKEEIMQKYSENSVNIYGLGHTPFYKDVIDAIVNDIATISFKK